MFACKERKIISLIISDKYYDTHTCLESPALHKTELHWYYD